MTARALRAVAVGAVLGCAVGYWVGTVFDGNGSFVLGSWAILWGAAAAVTGLGLGAGGQLGRSVLALVMAIVALGAWSWIVLWRVPPFTLEGAWIYPLALLATGAAVLASRSFARRSRLAD